MAALGTVWKASEAVELIAEGCDELNDKNEELMLRVFANRIFVHVPDGRFLGRGF